jgi:hypothetical protein
MKMDMLILLNGLINYFLAYTLLKLEKVLTNIECFFYKKSFNILV